MNESSPYDVTRDQQRNQIPQGEGTPAEHPERIGRYRIEKVLGKDGFGLVYLAQDEQLNRPVAVKVPPRQADLEARGCRGVSGRGSHGRQSRPYLIHRLSPLGAEASAIIKRLDDEPDITTRRALILSLGEFGEKELTPEDRKTLSPKLQEMYRTADDPSQQLGFPRGLDLPIVHSASRATNRE